MNHPIIHSPNKIINIMETRVIVIQSQKSNRSENTVWVVGITGEQNPRAFCKSAYKAMRFAFLLKKQTGLNISDYCLARLSLEIAKMKAEPKTEAKPEKAQQPEPQEEQPKPKRKRTKKSAQVVALK